MNGTEHLHLLTPTLPGGEVSGLLVGESLGVLSLEVLIHYPFNIGAPHRNCKQEPGKKLNKNVFVGLSILHAAVIKNNFTINVGKSRLHFRYTLNSIFAELIVITWS